MTPIISLVATITAMLTSISASAILPAQPSAADIIEELKVTDSPDVHPHFPAITPYAQDVEGNPAGLAGGCNKEACQSCIRRCGGLGNFSCFYFRCMNTECKGCKSWTS
ncbi:hypothetical protein F4824DRAFT_500543 [Ustulina deusta]|nr:hypothetical protein F4824DRAFT_500543 [Ustulina deusta]